MAGSKDCNEVQELSIQWLDLNKVTKSFGEINHSSKNQYKMVRTLIEKIINDYNKSQDKKTEKNKKHKKIIYKPGQERKKFENYFVRSFICKNEAETPLAKAFAKKKQKKTNAYYILFFYRKEPPTQIIAVTSDKAWAVVRPYVDYKFPFKIVEKVADPDKIHILARHHLLGSGTKEVLTNPSKLELHRTSNLFYLIDYLICKIRKESSLYDLFQPKLVSIKFTSQGILRIQKRMSPNNYPPILRLFEDYLKPETNVTDGLEKPTNPSFNFLYFFQPSKRFKKELDKLLVEAIFNQYKPDQKLPFHVRHKQLQEFLFSDNIEIRIDNGMYQRIEETPPEIEDILSLVNEKDEENFKANILGGRLRFNSDPNTEEALIDCIEGELRHPNKETYFKIRKVWYEVKAEYLSLLDEDFRSVLKKALIQRNEKGRLSHAWRGTEKQGRISVTALKDKLNLSKDKATNLLSDLEKSKVCFVSSENCVMQRNLVGDILKVKVIKKHKVVIENILCNPKNLLEHKIRQACKEDSDEVLKELCKERRVIFGKSKQEIFVHNPFPYHLKGMPNYDLLLELLVELYEESLTEKEETYCRSYLEEKGFLVFDQITPENIEPCDILSYTEDTVYLYHVKEKFGQQTRDVCSQILNAATVIRGSLSAQQSHSYLQSLWRESMNVDTTSEKSSFLWFDKVKRKMTALGERKFIDIFRDKKIVFVYAYLRDSNNSFSKDLKKPFNVSQDDLGGEHRGVRLFKILQRLDYVDSFGSLKNKSYFPVKQDFKKENVPEKDIETIFQALAKTRPSSKSTLAKMEVVHLAQNLGLLGFELKMCEIPKKKTIDERVSYCDEFARAGPSGA